MKRLILINRQRSPSRQELTTSEKSVGEIFFNQFDLKYAGYIIAEGTGKLCANWIIPDGCFDDLVAYAGSHELLGYEFAIWEPCEVNGRSIHRRVL